MIFEESSKTWRIITNVYTMWHGKKVFHILYSKIKRFSLVVLKKGFANKFCNFHASYAYNLNLLSKEEKNRSCSHVAR